MGANNRIKSGVVDGKPGGIAIGNIYGSTGLYKNECAVNNGTWCWVCGGQFDADDCGGGGGNGNGCGGWTAGGGGGIPFVPPDDVAPVLGNFGLGLDDKDGWAPAKLIRIGSNWFRSKPGGVVRDGCCCCCCTTAIKAASSNGGKDDDDDDACGGGEEDDDDEGIWTKLFGDRELLLLLLRWTLIGLIQRKIIIIKRKKFFFDLL